MNNLMQKKLNRIAQAVYADPWLIRPEQHAVIRGIVEAHMSGEAHLPDGCATLFEDAPEKAKPQAYSVIDNIAVISVQGTLGMRVGILDKMSGMTDFLDLQSAIDDAISDENVEGLILQIDSPGGTANGTPETASLIGAVKAKIPVVAFTDTQMASAAYWLAVPSDLIIATPSARVGSIGVYLALLDESRASENAGYKQEMFATGKYKGMGYPGLPLSQEQKDHLQASVDEIFEDFKSAVLANRPVNADAMQGQTFRALEAVGEGLIDEVGDFDTALQRTRELINERKNKS